jgi:NADPH-dependent curcumin reductase CurA
MQPTLCRDRNSEARPGQMLLRTIYLSLDPYMRGRMNAGPSYAPPVEIGEVPLFFI